MSTGHAYTILRLLDVEVTKSGKKETVQMLHVRNPHMTNAPWQGLAMLRHRGLGARLTIEATPCLLQLRSGRADSLTTMLRNSTIRRYSKQLYDRV